MVKNSETPSKEIGMQLQSQGNWNKQTDDDTFKTLLFNFLAHS